jgi:hypothetical protein
MVAWLDRCRLYRDRLIASPRVQRWALANPVTRPVAHRRARAMLDLCAGFVYSQVLFTCVRLSLFDILFKEPLTWPHRSLSLRRKCSTLIRSTGIAVFSTWAVAKEFSSPRRQRGRRPYAS